MKMVENLKPGWPFKINSGCVGLYALDVHTLATEK